MGSGEGVIITLNEFMLFSHSVQCIFRHGNDCVENAHGKAFSHNHNLQKKYFLP